MGAAVVESGDETAGVDDAAAGSLDVDAAGVVVADVAVADGVTTDGVDDGCGVEDGSALSLVSGASLGVSTRSVGVAVGVWDGAGVCSQQWWCPWCPACQ